MVLDKCVGSKPNNVERNFFFMLANIRLKLTGLPLVS